LAIGTIACCCTLLLPLYLLCRFRSVPVASLPALKK
jgi:hypothetical protein